MRSIILAAAVLACQPSSQGARDPGSPAPVSAGDAPATTAPTGRPGQKTGGLPAPASQLPGRAEDAPLVPVEEALSADSLLGHRVRVAGRCTAAGAGRRAGSWTLEDGGSSIEVRGLVPSSCAASSTVQLTIFAQIEPTSRDSRDRLLLRLPD